MFVITSYEALELDPQTATVEGIFEGVDNAFDMTPTAKGYRLSWGEDSESIIPGTDERFLAKVDAWSDEIKQEFLAALAVLVPSTKNGELPNPDFIPMDSADTFRLRKAAQELDNDWFELSEHWVYLKNEMGYAYFTCMPTEWQMENMHCHPEDYVLVEMSVY